MYRAPGALELPASLLKIWNKQILSEFARKAENGLGSSYVVADPSAVVDGNLTRAVRWSGAPAEPSFCLSRSWAQKLSDWGEAGRHGVQNEYCEYHATHRIDATGKRRLKRVEFTTELREFWQLLAEHDPERLRQHAEDVTGGPVRWVDLYGPGGTDPLSLPPFLRRVQFAWVVAGHGNDPKLVDMGVPVQPTGRLNREHALFMTHPINGLDDLIYIVLFGACPYAVSADGGRRQALSQEIFRAGDVTHLQCRNADSAAASGAYGAVWEGRKIAFADPLGVYIRPLSTTRLVYDGEPIPVHWVQYSRGIEGAAQRLVVGPPDGEDAFLDAVSIQTGAASVSITGGYQLASLFEVGPLITAGPPSAVPPEDQLVIPKSPARISCREAGVCRSIRALKDRYEAAHTVRMPGVRGGVG